MPYDILISKLRVPKLPSILQIVVGGATIFGIYGTMNYLNGEYANPSKTERTIPSRALLAKKKKKNWQPCKINGKVLLCKCTRACHAWRYDDRWYKYKCELQDGGGRDWFCEDYGWLDGYFGKCVAIQ